MAKRKMKMKGGFIKGTRSRTHAGDMDFTTKRGNKMFHRAGHDVALYHGKHQIAPFGGRFQGGR